jgi:uncharacterized membrane protein YdcZ (DUF606 family)
MALLLIVAYLGGGFLRVRSQRQTGVTHSFGHPVLDSLLLLLSGLLLAGTVVGVVALLKNGHAHPIKNRMIAYPLVVLAGGALTWLCGGILRRSRKS